MRSRCGVPLVVVSLLKLPSMATGAQGGNEMLAFVDWLLALDGRVRSFAEYRFEIREAGRYDLTFDADRLRIGVDVDYEFKRGDFGMVVFKES